MSTAGVWLGGWRRHCTTTPAWLGAFDTLFNKRDFETAATMFAPDYIQCRALVPAGREGVFELARRLPGAR